MDRLNQPATIHQIRLMFAASSLLGLFIGVGVTWWQLSSLPAGAQAAALRAFALAAMGGVFMTILLVRLTRSPLWTDMRGTVHPLWAILFVGGLLVLPVIGRLTHEALPIVLGYVLGFDLTMLAVLLLLLSRSAGPGPS
jgi:hypothetical protein